MIIDCVLYTWIVGNNGSEEEKGKHRCYRGTNPRVESTEETESVD